LHKGLCRDVRKGKGYFGGRLMIYDMWIDASKSMPEDNDPVVLKLGKTKKIYDIVVNCEAPFTASSIRFLSYKSLVERVNERGKWEWLAVGDKSTVTHWMALSTPHKGREEL